MKVFLFDDTKAKHEALPQGLAAVSERLKAIGLGGIEISAGFESPQQGIDALGNPPELWRLINSPDSLFLIDLVFKVGFGDSRFFDCARELPGLIEPGAVLKEFNRLYELIPPSEADNDTELALKLVCACKAVGQRVVMVSTLGATGTVEDLEELGLIDGTARIPRRDDTPDRFVAFANDIIRHVDPVESLRSKTHNWFFDDDVSPWDTFPAHDFISAKQDGTLAFARLPTFVRRVFPWFPEKPFPDIAAASAFHQVLKTFCGRAGGQWSGGTHALSLGGAYLLLLYAIQMNHPEVLCQDPKKFLVDFRDLVDKTDLVHETKPRPFLPDQPRTFAEVTFRALLALFLRIVTVKDTRECAISSISFDAKSGSVRAYLNWSPDHIREIAKSVLTSIEPGFNGSKESGIFRLDTVNTSGAMLRFVLASQVRERGFGAPGRVIIEGNGLFRLCP